MKKIEFYVPEEQKEEVKNAMFAAGAGKIGNYDLCSWECKGVGQFRPLEGSDAFKGELNKVERDIEYKVECVCDDKFLAAVVSAMKKTHPYETVAYQIFSFEY